MPARGDGVRWLVIKDHTRPKSQDKEPDSGTGSFEMCCNALHLLSITAVICG